MEKEIKRSIYVGISIFDILKNIIIEIDDKFISLEDKKYLSLYLGIINSENEISNKYKYLFSKLIIDYELICVDDYKTLYNEYFIKEINNVNFDCINDYFNFLLNKDIIKKVNKDNNVFVENNSNKVLVKK